MADITAKDLARGTKLTRDHIFDPLSAAATELTSTNIDVNNLTENWGTLRVNFHLPFLDARYFQNQANGTIRFSLPFTLPPLQEFFDALGLPGIDTPQMVLAEFQMSFDQRGEAAAIASREQVSPVNAGKVFPSALDRLDLGVALMEKPQWIYDNNTPVEPQVEIFSTNLPAEVWGGRDLRFNPVIVPDLNKQLSPYRTYILVLDATDIWSAGEKCVLPALNFSLKILHPLVARDAGTANVQNIPTVHAGSKQSPTVTINTPTAGSIISADATQGVQTNLKTIDHVLQAKLRGGYGKDSDVPVSEHIVADACYEVIMVPCWSGYGFRSTLTAGFAADVPAVGLGAPFVSLQQDEVTIPLAWPMTIHHVTLARNYQGPSDGVGGAVASLHPTSATFEQFVAVGIGTGNRSDTHTYQDVAVASWTNASKAAMTIDRLVGVTGSAATADTPTGGNYYDWELLHCPLVTGPQGGGVGYYAQGKPIFAGKASSKMWGRSGIGNGQPGDIPYTNGGEQFLQVNWAFQDINGLSLLTDIPAGAAANGGEIYVGYSGNWVQICGKKHIVGLEDEITI